MYVCVYVHNMPCVYISTAMCTYIHLCKYVRVCILYIICTYVHMYITSVHAKVIKYSLSYFQSFIQGTKMAGPQCVLYLEVVLYVYMCILV